MEKVISLLKGDSVSSLSIDDILEFITHYPEWLSRCDIYWNHISHIRNHLYCGKVKDDSYVLELLRIFICDLIQVSLSTQHVFSPFILTNKGVEVYFRYQDDPIDVDDFKRIAFNFIRSLKDHELSGVSFLLNILKEVNEVYDRSV